MKKQKKKSKNQTSGTGYAKVSKKELQDVLDYLSKQQTQRLKAAGLL